VLSPPRRGRGPLLGAVAILLLLTQPGCLLRSALYFARAPNAPMMGWEVRMDPGQRRECLVVMMPGLFDIPDELFSSGVIEDTARASDRCDLAVVDTNLGYYRTNTLVARLRADVLRVAEHRGYREIWLVGVSMGALGAVLLAREAPDRIEGMVLIAPWMGEEPIIEAANEAGGLAAWTPPEEVDRDNPGFGDNTVLALEWLRGYLDDDPGARPAIYFGVGDDDRWGHHAALVAEAVPDEHEVHLRGQHEWTTWRRLVQAFLAHPPWDPAATSRDPHRSVPALRR
jgi:pimeloyl-ACP methyl ester carboxylesterase